jgi:hypothetical protein
MFWIVVRPETKLEILDLNDFCMQSVTEWRTKLFVFWQ